MSSRSKVLKKLLIAVFWLIVWQIAAILVDNSVLLVGPAETLRALLELLPERSFLTAISATTARICAGFAVGALAGVLLAAVSYRLPAVRELLSPIIGLMKSVPVVSFIIILIIWFGSRMLSFYVTLIVVLPMLYIGTLEGLISTDKRLLEMAEIFRMSPVRRARGIYFPQLCPHLMSSLSLAAGMAFRSGVAAEVIGQPLGSLGNELYRAKIYLETDRLLAVTLTSVVLAWALTRLITLALGSYMRRHGGEPREGDKSRGDRA